MATMKKGVLVITAALGLMVAAPVHAQEYGYGYNYNGPSWQVRFRPRWWHHWRPQPVVIAQPRYSYGQPYYQQPVDFPSHVRGELAAIEAAVRVRVAAGELDGSALTAMEAARDDMEQDIVDLSAKGYMSDADRAHLESDLAKLRQRFGC